MLSKGLTAHKILTLTFGFHICHTFTFYSYNVLLFVVVGMNWESEWSCLDVTFIGARQSGDGYNDLV